MRATLVMCLALAAAPPAHAADEADFEVRRLKPGVFLYAAPRLREPNFSETVVLLVEYGPKGAMGLVIDRPTESTAGEVLKDAKGLARVKVYWGGPVQPEAVFALVRTSRPSKDATAVFADVYLTGKRKDIEAALKADPSGEHVRIYLGYAGWGAGQLEGEVRRDGWLVTGADANAVFSSEPEKVWPKAYQLQDRLEAMRLLSPRVVARWASWESRP